MEEKKDLTIEELMDSSYKLTEEVVEKLVTAFQYDFTVEEACTYAKIDRKSYYNWINASTEFLQKMEDARNFLFMSAKTILADAIKGRKTIKDDQGNVIKKGKKPNLQLTTWLLERRQKKNYSTQQNLAGADGENLIQNYTIEIIDKSEDIEKHEDSDNNGI